MSTPRIPIFLLTLAGVTTVPAIAFAEVVTDGSVGIATTLGGPNYNVASFLGSQSGNTLFHSFSELNLSTGETITFAGSAAIARIIVRVTGGNVSTLDGVVRCSVNGADVFVINDAGLSFSANASLDGSGDFTFAAVEAIGFDDMGIFNAMPTMGEVLSTGVPNRFDVDASPGPLTIQDASLTGLTSLYLLGGAVTIDGATLQANKLHIAGVGDGHVTIEGDGSLTPVSNPPGTITLSNSPTFTAPGGVNIAPAYCGDGYVNPPEACDDGVSNSDVLVDACRSTCVLAHCGDGVVDTGETCDMGASNSDVNADACRSTCVPASCGDGVTDGGEGCDDGNANDDATPDACRTDCSAPSCGDGVVDSGEGCDDGAQNVDGVDGSCNTSCSITVSTTSSSSSSSSTTTGGGGSSSSGTTSSSSSVGSTSSTSGGGTGSSVATAASSVTSGGGAGSGMGGAGGSDGDSPTPSFKVRGGLMCSTTRVASDASWAALILLALGGTFAARRKRDPRRHRR